MILFPYHRFVVEVDLPPAEVCRGVELYLQGAIPPVAHEWMSFDGWVDGNTFYLQKKLAAFSYDPLGFTGRIMPGPKGAKVEITLAFEHMWLLIAAPVPFLILLYYASGQLALPIAVAILFYGAATVSGMLRYWWVLAVNKKDVVALLLALKDKLNAHKRKLAKPGHQSLDY